MGTNFDDIEPMKYVKRWCTQNKKKVDIPQPNVISNYNNGMGGVDLHDQAVNAYKIRIRGKKWWWSLFISMLNSIMVNAWKLYKDANDSTIDLLEFQRQITRHYLRNYTVNKPKKRSAIRSVATVEGPHFPKRMSTNTDNMSTSNDNLSTINNIMSTNTDNMSNDNLNEDDFYGFDNLEEFTLKKIGEDLSKTNE